MKTQIDLIFGKSTVDKSLYAGRLARDYYPKEKVLIIEREKSDKAELNSEKISRFYVGGDVEIDYALLIKAWELFKYDRVIIEMNENDDIKRMINKLSNKEEVGKKFIINNIISILDSKNFKIDEDCMKLLKNSDTVIFKEEENLNNMINSIYDFNPNIEIISMREDDDNYELIYRKEKESIFFKAFMSLIVILGIFLMGYQLSIQSADGMFYELLASLKSMMLIFIAILLEATPFLLIGVSISAIIEVFVSRDLIDKIFCQNKLRAYLVAIFSGLFIPVCDCAIVPVCTRLIKKGVPVSHAITFMLCAPVINPIVLVSTTYAFKSFSTTISRMTLGLIVGLISGIAVSLLTKKDKIKSSCYISEVDDSLKKHLSMPVKMKLIFTHAKDDFFRVYRYLIIGALIASFMQQLMPQSMHVFFNKNQLLSSSVMMLMAFLLSLCSSSDAFIARSMISTFGYVPVMAFMVFGPMIDLKNVLLLSDTFRKKFSLVLTLTVFLVTLLVVSVYGIFI